MNLLELFSSYYKIVIASLIGLAVLSLIDKTLAIGVLFVLFLSSLALWAINKLKDKKTVQFLSILFIIVFLVHAAAVAIIYYTHFQPFSEGRGDFNEYNSVAQEISKRVSVGNFSLREFDEFPHLVNYYPVIVGYLYFLTAPSMLIGQLFNAWIVALICISIFLLVVEIGRSKREALMVGLLAGFYPSLFFYGSLLLKDALSALLAMIGLLLTLKVIKHFSWPKLIMLYVTLIGATHLRFYIAYALVINVVIFWFVFSDLKVNKRIIYGIIMIILFGFLPFFALDGRTQGYMGLGAVKSFLNPHTIISYRDLAAPPQGNNQPSPSTGIQPSSSTGIQPSSSTGIQPSSSTGIQPSSSKDQPDKSDLLISNGQVIARYSSIAQDSSVNVAISFDKPILFLKSISLSFAYVVLGPFPWHLTEKKHLFVLPEMIAWYVLLFFIIKGLIRSIRNDYKSILPIIFFSLLIFGVLTFYMNNFGIITRIRMPAFLALLCLLPFGIPATFSQKFFEVLNKGKSMFVKYVNVSPTNYEKF